LTFSITGFGAVQLTAASQLFQALSLGGAPPVPPAPPYGTPNPNLVPVARSSNPPPAVPVNLTLAAHSSFQAILKVNQSLLAFGHPPIPPTPNTTTAVSATNPAISNQVQGASPNGLLSPIDFPQGPVSFDFTAAPANLTSGVNAVTQTIAQLEQGEQKTLAAPTSPNPFGGQLGTGSAPAGLPAAPSSHPDDPPAPDPAPVSHGATGTIPAAASPGLVGKIAQTVRDLAVAAVYSAPVFSFSA
jgi:hypothetical protein